MDKTILFSVFIALFANYSLAGKIYKCKDENGKLVFSQTQCGDEVKDISSELKKGTFSTLQSKSHLPPKKPLSSSEQANQDYKDHLKKRTKIQGSIDALKAQRDRKIAALQKRINQTTFKSDHQRYRSEMSKVRKEYQARINKMHRSMNREHRRYVNKK